MVRGDRQLGKGHGMGLGNAVMDGFVTGPEVSMVQMQKI